MSANQHLPSEARSISRRSLVKGAATVAWTVPAVQLVSAVPAFAGSNDPTCSCVLTIEKQQWTGNAGFHLKVLVVNTSTLPCGVVTLTIEFDGRELTWKSWSDKTDRDWNTPSAGSDPITVVSKGGLGAGKTILFSAHFSPTSGPESGALTGSVVASSGGTTTGSTTFSAK
ncbi:hypothetical protein [Nocardioides iriomotensis]|uniref:Uncharacterized protein n=1 Tax=Nocardioides iriomotensis TaxID=715784 RepID=A0A4Q5J7C6_9ACTN|nr:hypothetical protein [Nocardioides iriomotensis]RYU13679.1 hypothetical protein ETU37_05410 [Nocardioides iriomotensis]